MSEFNDMTQDELDGLRGQVHAFNHPANTVEEDKAQMTAHRLRVEHIMRLPSDKTSADDQSFLRAQINAALKAL